MRRVVVLLGSIAAAACGLSVTGQFVGEEEGATSPSRDASSSSTDGSNTSTNEQDAEVDAPVLDVDAATLCDSGLSASVVIVPDGTAACPAGTMEQTVQTNPVAAAGACTCGTCTPVTNPSCASATKLGVSWGGSNSCGSGSDSYTIADNACIDWGYGNFDLVAYHGWQARTPTAGSCTATAVPDATKVTTTARRQCVPTSASAVCEAQASGKKLCVDSGGATCAGTFSQTVVIGDAPDVTCAACGCSRTSASCTVEYHTNSACTQLRYTTQANGVCTRTNDATSVQYLKVFPSTPTCNASPGAATPSLKNKKTLCCTP